MNIAPGTLALASGGQARMLLLMNETGSTFTITQTPSSASFSPALPSGTTIASTNCLAGSSVTTNRGCVIVLRPGSTVSNDSSSNLCTTGTAPVPSVLTVETSAGNVTANVYVLGNGCLYQSGYIFALDDTAPVTGSVGGTVVSTASNASASFLAEGFVWGVNDTSDIVTTSDLPSQYLNSGQLNCYGVNDGACNSNNITIIANQYAPDTSSAVYQCAAAYGGYIDWYVPSICELGPYGSGGSYPAGTGSQTCLSSANIQTNLMGIANVASTLPTGSYWSSTSLPQEAAGWQGWYQVLNTSGGSQTSVIAGDTFLARCVRHLTE